MANNTDVDWLASAIGQSAIEFAGTYADPLQAVSALRKKYSDVEPHLLSHAQTQARLQRTLNARWDIPVNNFLLTDSGIEQATRPTVAQYRAELVSQRFGRGLRILDLTCGLGFDALAFAREGHHVTAIEIDAATAAMACYNLRHTDANVLTGDSTQINLPAADLIFVDPARRTGSDVRKLDGSSPRIFDASQWSPSWEFVSALADHTPVIAKVAPGVTDDTLGNWSAEWISESGDLVEAMLYSDQAQLRKATLIGGAFKASYIGGAQSKTSPLGKWLIAPDLALIRAQALDAIVDIANAGLVNEHIAWLTSSDATAVNKLLNTQPRLGSVFAILEVLSFNEKMLKAQIGNIPASALTVMTRGVNVDVEALRKKLFKKQTSGSEELVLAIFREDSGPVALLARRVAQGSQVNI